MLPESWTPALELATQGRTDALAHVAEVALLAIVDIFGDTAGEHDAAQVTEIGDRVGQIEMLHVVGHRPDAKRRNDRLGHAVGHLVELFARHRVAELPFEARTLGVVLAGRIQARDLEILVDHHEAAANVEGSRCNALALF